MCYYFLIRIILLRNVCNFHKYLYLVTQLGLWSALMIVLNMENSPLFYCWNLPNKSNCGSVNEMNEPNATALVESPQLMSDNSPIALTDSSHSSKTPLGTDHFF